MTSNAKDAPLRQAQASNGRGHGLAGVPLAVEPLNRKDFTSDQEVRWCPGCGDYAVLSAFQGFMPELGIRKENTVIISGIGCSSRFPYYVDSFGMHSIHGRATAIATGVATAREDLAVFVITGDGDALSIGGNHLIHVLRRNVNVTILLFNNRIYGLTKGQYSPTSELGKITKSTPLGSLDNPVQPGVAGSGCGGDLRGAHHRLRSQAPDRGAASGGGAPRRVVRGDLPELPDLQRRRVRRHEGRRHRPTRSSRSARRADPLRCRRSGSGVTRDPVSGEFAVVDVDEVGVEALVVHDAHAADPSFAFGLSRLTDAGVLHRAPIGIFRDVDGAELRRSGARAGRAGRRLRQR